MAAFGVNNQANQVIQKRVSYINDSRTTGYGNRVIDYAWKAANSRVFDETANDEYDHEIRTVMSAKSTYSPSTMMKSYLLEKIGDCSPAMISVLMSSAIDRMVFDAYRKFGIWDVFAMYMCEINPTNLLLAIADSIPDEDIWRVALKEMPSRGGSIERSFLTSGSTEICIRPVFEADRGHLTVGPFILVHNGDKVLRTAVVDLVSFSNNHPEFIIFGNDIRYTPNIGGVDFGYYRHTDSPTSKTACPHYRLYNIWGNIIINSTVFDVPVILARLIRGQKRGHNLLEMLPYAEDLLYLIHHRPSIERTVVALICAAFSGKLMMGVYSVENLRSLVNDYKDYKMSSVFSGSHYKKWAYTDAFHGSGFQWDKLYDSMFV